MLPNVADVLTDWEVNVILKTVTVTTINFEKVVTVDPFPIRAVCQPAEKSQLKPEIVDWNLEYLWVHYKGRIVIDQYVEHRGKNWRVVQAQNWHVNGEPIEGDLQDRDYGYSEAVCEEVKGEIG